MKVLVLGSGGREHALAWKLYQSQRCEEIYLHPGNAGTQSVGFQTLGNVSDKIQDLLPVLKEKKIQLVVIGPEAYLNQGYADILRAEGFTVLGPNRRAAQLECSKVFAKEFMQRAGIPTATFSVVGDKTAMIQQAGTTWPVVLKLDGLAAGKGVVIAHNPGDVQEFAQRIYDRNEFGPGPHRVVIEQFIGGRELSYIGLCDGERFLALSSSTDFKRVGDHDTGPNTGGMGVVSPSPFFSADLERKIQERVILPVLAQLKKEELEYRGVLYVGVMIADSGDPYVLEFNTRFGDPETQAILPRMESDFLEYVEATAKAKLSHQPDFQWAERYFVYVVGAAEGYPNQPKLGDRISGISDLKDSPAEVFFSGVKKDSEGLVTGGGRVLGLGCLGVTLEDARTQTYDALKKIRWRGMHYRSDIGIWR